MTRCDLFAGIDAKAKLRERRIELSTSQWAVLGYLARASNDFGLVKGPRGTGKTKLDIVVTTLLMSANKKVKVLSPTNKAADLYTIKLNAELARLRDLGIAIAEKHVVRFHSPTLEQIVVQEDSSKYTVLDTKLTSMA